MPFKSHRQRRFMFAKHPKIAHRWARKYGTKPQGGKSGGSSGKSKGRKS